MKMALQNKLKAFVRFDGSGRVIPSSLILQKSKPKVGNWKEINATQCCNYTPTSITTTTTTTNYIYYNFDVDSSDWAGAGITDQATFNSVLGVTTDQFLLSGNNIQANILGTDNSLQLNSKNITNVNYITIPNLTSLQVSGNPMSNFNPTLPLPSGLLQLGLYNNQIVTFNPTLALPSNLQILGLNGNKIVTFNPTSLPNSLQGLDLGMNQIVNFNPTLPLPISLTELYLWLNQMTVAGYIASEAWATSQPAFSNTCNIRFNFNVDSISGTNLETILLTKNTTIET